MPHPDARARIGMLMDLGGRPHPPHQSPLGFGDLVAGGRRIAAEEIDVLASPVEEAEQILRESTYLSIRFLRCSYEDGVLTIRGRVPSFYLKQLSQSLVNDISGVQRIENQVEVSV